VVRFGIVDGATAQVAPVEVTVVGYGPRIDHVVDDLLATISVRTWPEGAVVGTDIEVVMEPKGVRRLRIIARATLDDRWYRAGFDSLPAGVLITSPGEDNGVRFRPGSHPRVASIQFCGLEYPNVTQKMVVVFSEPVAVAPAGVVSLSSAAPSVACNQDDASESELHFVCVGLTPAASVTVSIGPGLMAVSGEAMPPGRFDLDLGRLPASDCRLFMPPI
jgi:hypothetical protein